MPRLADHILGMPASGVRHILEQALRLDDVIILAVGEPGEEAAPAIREAAAQAWRDGLTPLLAEWRHPAPSRGDRRQARRRSTTCTSTSSRCG